MKALIIVLVLLAFFQSALLSADLVLVLLVVRSFLVSEKSNLWLAFGLGLLISLLTAQPLGLVSLMYLVSVFLVQLAKNSRLTSSWWSVLPLVFVCSFILQLAHLLFLGQSITMLTVFYQLLSTIPLYFGLRLWEERFVVPGHIRLKL